MGGSVPRGGIARARIAATAGARTPVGKRDFAHLWRAEAGMGGGEGQRPDLGATTPIYPIGDVTTFIVLSLTGVLGRSLAPTGTSPIFFTTARLAASAVLPKAVY